MKFLKVILFFSFLSPVFLLKSIFTQEGSERVYHQVVDLESIELEGVELLFDHVEVKEVANAVDYTRLFTYDEALSMQTNERRLPTETELKNFLLNAGFNSEGPFGLIPNEYYDLGLKYPGIIDPILGHVNQEEKLGLWFLENDQGHNYISIEKNELTFKVGRVLPHSKMSLRYLTEK